MDWERLHTQIQQLPNIKVDIVSSSGEEVGHTCISAECWKRFSLLPNSKLRVIKSIDSITDLSDFEYLSNLQDCSIQISGDLRLPSRWSNSLRSLSLWANQSRLRYARLLPIFDDCISYWSNSLK